MNRDLICPTCVMFFVGFDVDSDIDFDTDSDVDVDIDSDLDVSIGSIDTDDGVDVIGRSYRFWRSERC